MKTAIISSFLLLAIPLIASVPDSINYQGKITDTMGVALDGSYDLVFRICDSASGGTVLWTESHTGVHVDHGLFDVILGQTAALDIPFDGQYWIEIEVEGEILSPRQPLNTVPYAFRAEIAESLSGGVSADSDWTRSGNYIYAYNISDSVGIGITSPTDELHVMGNTRLAPSALPLWGTNPYMLVKTDLTHSYALQLNLLDGNTASPRITMGTGAGTGTFETIGNIGLNIDVSGSSYKIRTLDAAAATLLDRINVEGRIDEANITIMNSNVGIGTTAPAEKLEIAGNLMFSDGATREIYVHGTSGDGQDLFIYAGRSSGAGIGGDLILQGGTSGGTDGNVLIADRGLVGIGTESPTYKLEVDGDARIADDFYLGTVPDDAVHDSVLTIDGGQVKKVDAASVGSADNDWQISGSDMYSLPSGKVGIGTTGPVGKLQVQFDSPSTSDLMIAQSVYIKNTNGTANNEASVIFGSVPGERHAAMQCKYTDHTFGSVNCDLHFWTVEDNSLGRRLTIKDNGNVGIGTTGPSQKLHVNGTARMTGFQMPTGASDGYVLTSNASGSGSWQPLDDTDWAFSSGSGISGDIYHTGDVGIGTNSPSYRLHVNEDFGSSDGIAAYIIGSGGSGVTYPDIYALKCDANMTSNGLGVGLYGRAHSSSGAAELYGVRGSVYSGSVSSNLKGVIGQIESGSSSASAAAIYGVVGGIGIPFDGPWAGFFEGDVHVNGKMGIGTRTPDAELDVDGYIIMRKTAIRNCGFEGGTTTNWTAVSGVRTPALVESYNKPPEGRYCFGHAGDDTWYGGSDALVWGLEQDVPDIHQVTEASRLRFYTYGDDNSQYHHWHLVITYTDATTTTIDNFLDLTHGIPSGKQVYLVDLNARGATLNKTIDEIKIEIHKDHSGYTRYPPEVYLDGFSLFYE